MRRVLHLVRRSGEAPPGEVVGPDDRVAALDERPADEILDLLDACDVAVLWGPPVTAPASREPRPGT